MSETVAWDYWMKEGKKWITEGERRGMVRFLLLTGQKRLGAPDEEILAALNKVRDLDRLERVDDATLTATSWQDVLATP